MGSSCSCLRSLWPQMLCHSLCCAVQSSPVLVLFAFKLQITYLAFYNLFEQFVKLVIAYCAHSVSYLFALFLRHHSRIILNIIHSCSAALVQLNIMSVQRTYSHTNALYIYTAHYSPNPSLAKPTIYINLYYRYLLYLESVEFSFISHTTTLTPVAADDSSPILAH